MVWDFAEVSPGAQTSGSYLGAVEWISLFVSHALNALRAAGGPPALSAASAVQLEARGFDVVLTDPPYYDAIPYSDLMDFFYVWLRRSAEGLSPDIDRAFARPLGPKWNHEVGDGELIDEASRFAGDHSRSTQNYEAGMAKAFARCSEALNPNGRLGVVFANKQPAAWETLVAAIVRSGFVVDGSWPIQTEMGNRTRALSSAALSSSVWLVCRKRPETARPGWDNLVLQEMRANIHDQLLEFWDAGIRGPDFVWAATGPALEAYSKHPVVRKANEPGKVMEVSEFLRAVRRIVVDFVVGRVLSLNGSGQNETGLDDITTYYMLHRHDFGLEDAPSGACILYAVSCNLSDKDLADRHEVLVRTGGQSEEAEEEADAASDEVDSEAEEGTGSKVKLRGWHQRKRKNMGYDAEGAPAPMIDQVHRLMHLWKAGDLARVDEYVDSRALRRNALFHQLLQALIELAPAGTEERSLLESISNHLASRGPVAEKVQMDLPA
jgi:adenine-specific DNA methylase